MADPKIPPVMEEQTESPNDVKGRRNKTSREQYLTGYLGTTMARSNTQ